MYQPKYQPPKRLYIALHIPYIAGNTDRYVVSRSITNRRSSARLHALDKKLPGLQLYPRRLASCIPLSIGSCSSSALSAVSRFLRITNRHLPNGSVRLFLHFLVLPPCYRALKSQRWFPRALSTSPYTHTPSKPEPEGPQTSLTLLR